MCKDKEAFLVWLAAYTKNYDNTGLMDADPLAEQAWYAAIDYCEREKHVVTELKKRITKLESGLTSIVAAALKASKEDDGN